MLIIPQTVEMTWTPKYRNYYELKGYNFTKYYDKFEVNVLDLPINSNKKVQFLCDYCLENGKKTVIQTTYQDYLKRKRGIISKDCCKKCVPVKIKESNLLVYGVESTNQVKEIKEKRIKTNIKRYGGPNCMNDPKVRRKIEITNIKKYGVKAPAQNKLIKEKMKKTNMLKYGGVSPSFHPKVREKQLQTMIKKYGVECGFKSDIIKSKARKSLYMNGTAPTSYQQRYINSIVKGELNYPYKNYSLDIAIPKDKVYIECDFGGHQLQVKLGNKTEEQFLKDERKRWYALYRNGWKEIRIISSKDKVPSANKVKEMLDFAYAHFEKGHSWIRFYLDENKVTYQKRGRTVEEKYDFGELYYK